MSRPDPVVVYALLFAGCSAVLALGALVAFSPVEPSPPPPMDMPAGNSMLRVHGVPADDFGPTLRCVIYDGRRAGGLWCHPVRDLGEPGISHSP